MIPGRVLYKGKDVFYLLHTQSFRFFNLLLARRIEICHRIVCCRDLTSLYAKLEYSFEQVEVLLSCIDRRTLSINTFQRIQIAVRSCYSFAPAAFSRVMISALSQVIAICSGVTPSLSALLTSAPAAIRIFTISELPKKAATCRGVSPSLFALLTSAPAAISMLTISEYP